MSRTLTTPVRYCHLCRAHYGTKVLCDGELQNGRMRLGGGETLIVSGRTVTGGKIYNVCADHRAAMTAQRALGRQLGHEGRQASEAAALSDTDTLETAENRAPRLAALESAALATITRDEFNRITAQADMVTSKAHRGTLAHESAFDNVLTQFVARISQAAFRDIADDVDATEAVNTVDRNELTRGLSYVNVTRTGQLAREGSVNSAPGANGADAELSGAEYGDFAALIGDDTDAPAETYVVDGLNLSAATIAQAAFVLATIGTRDGDTFLVDASADFLIRAANYAPARPVRPALHAPAPRVIEQEAAPVESRKATAADLARVGRAARVSSPWAA